MDHNVKTPITRNEDGTLTACKYENLIEILNTDKTGPEYLNTTKILKEIMKQNLIFQNKCHLIYNNDSDEMEKAAQFPSAKYSL